MSVYLGVKVREDASLQQRVLSEVYPTHDMCRLELCSRQHPN